MLQPLSPERAGHAGRIGRIGTIVKTVEMQRLTDQRNDFLCQSGKNSLMQQ
jgi:hypothetical protein